MVKLIDNFTDAEGNIVKQTQRKKKDFNSGLSRPEGYGKRGQDKGGNRSYPRAPPLDPPLLNFVVAK